ncbi:GNAT family N-acetyltransferase [Umezawaea tangerina]|uniref:Acetyltransferase (GNAT) family protein n=1 Tax=Umezawaea tangerina TaxID=84725 RepID=A0A2T0TED0_9PSEU|nr:GNAT family N-acetyltransferase [Umezawaea tangerina]PRY43978.1 acetyltransferase (GNAT) family protein [Umezawaea tangerina]
MTVDQVRLEVRRVSPADPATAPMMAELTHEYVTRYGERAREEMARYPTLVFEPPDGTLLLLVEGGEPVAGGAFKRYDERTAELKRIWTAAGHRRRGLGRRVVLELEREAAALDYRRVYLTTGTRQPEAKALYLALGYTPLFDVDAAPPTSGPLPFGKTLPCRTPPYEEHWT